MLSRELVCTPVFLWAFAGVAAGAMTYQTQSRTVSVTTSFDGGAQAASAPDFNPFVQTVSLSTVFPGVSGPGLNRAKAGIDCHLDPNKLLIAGALAASGGVSLVDGKMNEETGDAISTVTVSFHLDADSAFSLLASARPSVNPKDKFKIKLAGPSGGAVIFFLDEKSPVQNVNLSGILAAGDYSLEYEAEMSVGVGDVSSDYSLTLEIPSPGSAILAMGAGLLAIRRRR